MDLNQILVTNESQIIEIPVTPWMLEKAKARAAALGCLNEHSMMKGKRNMAGMLGEEAALVALPQAVKTESYDHDIRIGKLLIDVKSKQLKHKPKLYYDCSIYGYNTEQQCHIYLFCGVKEDYSRVWFSGFLAKHIFYQKAKFFPAGSIVGSNQLQYKEDNYTCQVKDLNRFSILQEIKPKP